MGNNLAVLPSVLTRAKCFVQWLQNLGCSRNRAVRLQGNLRPTLSPFPSLGSNFPKLSFIKPVVNISRAGN